MRQKVEEGPNMGMDLIHQKMEGWHDEGMVVMQQDMDESRRTHS